MPFQKSREKSPALTTPPSMPAAVATAVVPKDREEELEAVAEDWGDWTEKDCGIGWEFFWRKSGKDYRYYVSGETVGLRVEHNEEFYGGNQHFVSRYRGFVLVSSTDPRLQKKIEPDPGPEIQAKGGNGKCTTMPVSEFLGIVNKNKAKRRNMEGLR